MHSVGLYSCMHSVGLYSSMHSVGLYNCMHSVGLYSCMHSVGLYNFMHSVGLYNCMHSVGLYNCMHSVGLYNCMHSTDYRKYSGNVSPKDHFVCQNESWRQPVHNCTSASLCIQLSFAVQSGGNRELCLSESFNELHANGSSLIQLALTVQHSATCLHTAVCHDPLPHISQLAKFIFLK
jgi:hypothetical protein